MKTIKKIIEYSAILIVLFLLMTIDSYSTLTLAIGASVFLIAWAVFMYRNRNRRVNVAHFPKVKDATDFENWLRQTIDKIDRMDDK